MRRAFAFALFVAVVAIGTGYVWGPIPSSLPVVWFWGDVEGQNLLTRLSTEHAPRYCRSSWALSTAAALSDRLKIANRGTHPDTVLAPQVLLNCVPSGGCSGGHPFDALEYIHDSGIPDETCQSYIGAVQPCDARGVCRDCTHGPFETVQSPSRGVVGRTLLGLLAGRCWGVESFQRYGLHSYGRLLGDAVSETDTPMVERMKAEIYARGPITCGVSPTAEFERYTEGVLVGQSDASRDLHYINVVGWDASGHTKYWIIRNCWGEAWGMSGYAKIAMGHDALGIETECYWGTPSLYAKSVNDAAAEADRGLYRVRNSGVVGAPCSCVSPELNSQPRFRLSRPDDAAVDIPASYDIRNVDGVNFATFDKNQHIPVYCGSCWAFACVVALADRYALRYPHHVPYFDLAPQVLMNCVHEARGCSGGRVHYGYEYIEEHGIPHESCAPYQAIDQECTPSNVCKSCDGEAGCAALPETELQLFGVVDHGSAVGVEDMKREILLGGPIACLCALTPDFVAYSGGIFNDTSSRVSRDHYLEVAGWGEEDGVQFWIVRNSWGTYWGERGWARIAMGAGDLGLSQIMCDWAEPRALNISFPSEALFKTSSKS